MTLTIAHRLILGFALVLLITLGFGWYQLGSLKQMRDFATDTNNRNFEALQMVRRIGNRQREMSTYLERAWVAYLLSKSHVGSLEVSVPQKQWELTRDRVFTLVQALETTATTNIQEANSRERKELWEKARQNARDTQEILKDLSSIAAAQFDSMGRDQVKSSVGQFQLLDDLGLKFAAIGAKTEELTDALSESAESDILELYETVTQATLIILACALVIGLTIAGLIYKSITRPLTEFMEFVAAVGKGDLTRRAANVGSDEIGRLGVTLNEMVDNLAEVTGQTKMATENLNAATAELQASAQQQAASTSEQSAAVQQITSTLEEITQSGRQISDRAKGVAQNAEAAASASKSGLQAVVESSRAIQSIRDQAERVAGTVVTLTEKTQSVGEIIASVNEIAERSNLLALNAAIEAAAAGEQGASFSVVADEIKNLANQAKDATGQVRGLLSEIQQGINSAVMQTEEAVKRADFGAEQSKQTEGTITELAHSVEQSIATFEQIIAATSQQQIGIEQVSVSVRNIREASDQIAAGINDLEKSATNLNAMGGQLRQSVARYRL